MVFRTKNTDLTPQESEQLSQYASDDDYVQRQKVDIQELTSMFKDMLGGAEEEDEYTGAFKKAFHPLPGFRAGYKLFIGDHKEPLGIWIAGADLKCGYGTNIDADVEIRVEKDVFQNVIYGRMTFQRAFMSGEMKMKGDFKLLRTLDQVFVFGEK